MEEKFAKGISYILHPLLMPAYFYSYMLYQDSFYAYLIPVNAKWMIIMMVFVTTFLIPCLVNIMLLSRGFIHSLQMETREERLFPFMITAGCFYLCAYLVKYYQLPGLFYLFSLGITMLVVIALFINFSFKISAHMTGTGALLGTFIGLSFKWILNFQVAVIALVIIAGLTAYSRLRLKAHRPVEVYTGFFLGLVVMLGIFLLI